MRTLTTPHKINFSRQKEDLQINTDLILRS
jgi:hypothetical protein